jgi:uncharacterized SAM-binding protein YcdF (DUF218 family)
MQSEQRRSGKWWLPAQKWQRWLLYLFGGIILSSLVAVITLGVIIINYGSKDRAQQADVIVVLGGGQSGTTRRTWHAAALYTEGYADYLICSGGTGKHERISEAERCARSAEKRGVPADAIILEEHSLSTEENAIETAAIMHARGWDDAILVSDDYHLWRAHWLFEAEGVHVFPSPAQTTVQSLNLKGEISLVMREIAATGWYVAKSVLGLPNTRFGN